MPAEARRAMGRGPETEFVAKLFSTFLYSSRLRPVSHPPNATAPWPAGRGSGGAGRRRPLKRP